jgi:hypothetical protein
MAPMTMPEPRLARVLCFFILSLSALSMSRVALGDWFPLAPTGARNFVNGLAGDGTTFLLAMEGPRGCSQVDPDAATIVSQLASESEALVGPAIDIGSCGHAPAIAFDGTNYLFIWDQEENIIYGQMIAKNGSKVGQSFSISEAKQVEVPKVAFGAGNYLVVWSIFTRSAPDAFVYHELRGSIVSTSGMVEPGEFLLSTTAGRDAAVAFDGTNFLVVWIDTPNEKDILGQFISPTGSKVGSQFVISTNQFLSAGPGIDLLFAGRSYFVIFNDLVATQPSENWDLFAQSVKRSGELAGAAIPIATGPSSQVAGRASYGAGQLLVTWSDWRNDANSNFICDSDESTCDDIYGRFFDSLGAPVSQEFRIVGDNGNQAMSSVAFGATKFFVAYNTADTVDRHVSDAYGTTISPAAIAQRHRRRAARH